MGMYRYISLSKIQYRLPVVLLMALLAVHVASGESDKQDGQRTRRDSKAECVLKHEYWDGNQCKFCLCAPGEQSTAEFCGYGVIAGEPGCEPCPDDTYRNGSDISIHCHPCSVCDPDATITLNCTKVQDTLCACKEGMGVIDNHCVSCKEHPEAKNCSDESVKVIPADEPKPEPKPTPDQKSECEDKRGYIVGMVVIGISCIVIGIVIGILIKAYCIGSKQGDSNRDGNGRDGQDPSLDNGVETPLNHLDTTNPLVAPPESASPSSTPVASTPSAGSENRTSCCSIDCMRL